MHLYKNFSARRYLALTASEFRIGSPKTARNEQVCAHQKSYSKQIFLNLFFAAVVYRMDCICAPMLRFFSVASDGATTERQI